MEENSKKIIYVLGFTFLLSSLIIFLSIYNNNNSKKNDTSLNIEKEQKEDSERRQRDELERKQDEEIKKEQEIKIKQEKEMKEKEELKKKKELEIQKEAYRNEKEKKRKENEEKFLKIKNELGENLLKLGFIQKDNCYSIFWDKDICYSNNIYEIVNHEYNSISFTKNVNEKDLINYDCKNDVTFIANILDNNELSINSYYICKVINLIGNRYSSSFSIKIGGLYLDISDYSNKLKYNISNSLYNDTFYPNDIRSIINSEGKENSYVIKKEMFDLAMLDNKKYFDFYDYINTYFNKNSNNICNVNYHSSNGYIMDSSFCHAGTSNTYYQFNYHKFDEQNYNSIIIDIKGEYFKKMYFDIINNDLNYFSNKLNLTLELNDYNKQLLTKFVNNDELDISLSISDNIIINIKYYPNYYFRDYKIEYIIK